MAQAPKQAADRAAFVREIVSDPKAVPNVMLLYGYLGASSEEDHERLYLSPDLTNYVEVPTSAILHQMAAPEEQDPHGGVTLWVKKDAALIYKMAPAAEALAHYFAGAIAGGAAGGPQPVPLDAPYFAAQTLYPRVCTPQCNTRHPYCGTVTPACTHGASCWCLPPAGAAAMAAGGPQPAPLDAPYFAGQTLYPHVCTPQYGTFHTQCCPMLTYQSVCCPVSPFCPAPTAFCPGSLACPGSIACGPGQQVPGQQAAFAMARGASAFCTPGCSPVCTGVQCNTPAHPCTPHCPQ